MATLTQEQIKEIADQLDSGFTCYYNKQNNDLLFIPDPDNHPDLEMDAWKDDLKKIKKHRSSYIVIQPPQSRDSFEIMAQFVDTLADNNKLKNVLIQALEKQKPFREFKFAIDNSGEFRQKWFDFKSEKNQERVKNELGYFDEKE